MRTPLSIALVVLALAVLLTVLFGSAGAAVSAIVIGLIGLWEFLPDEVTGRSRKP